MIRVLVILLISLCCLRVESATDIRVLNANLLLTDSPGQSVGEHYWNFYNGTDEPFGGYNGWMFPGFSNVTGVIPLNTTLPAGTYGILLKSTDYSVAPLVRFTLPGVDYTFLPNNDGSGNEWRAPWQTNIIVTTTGSATTLGIELIKTTALSIRQNFLVRAVLINSNTNLAGTKFDYLVDFTYPTVMDNVVDSATNVVLNSSFELGMAHHWHNSTFAARTNISAMIDTALVQHGEKAAKCRYQQDLMSRVYRLKPNKQYTFSAYVRSVSNGNVRMSFDQILDIPTNYPSATLVSTDRAVNNAGWTRISYTTNALDYPEPFYKFRISPQSEIGLVYVDSVMVTEGSSLLTYAENPGIDVGIHARTNMNVIWDSESLVFDFMVRNPTASSSNTTIIYDVRDYKNVSVLSNNFSATVGAASTLTNAVTLSSFTGYGTFRLSAWPASAPQNREEIVFLRAHTPRTAATNSMFGTHPNIHSYYVRGLARAGMPFVRTLSPGSVYSWAKVEATDNVFNWANVSPPADFGTTNFLDGGGVVFGTLFEAPTWAKTGPYYVDQAAWTNYIGTVVDRYKNVVKFWEVWNEPQFIMSNLIYATNLMNAYNIIKAVDPTAYVVGFGGMSEVSQIDGVRTNIGSTWTNFFDAAAIHVYPDSENKLVALRAAIPANKPLWNDETGIKDQGFLVGLNHDENLYGSEHIWGAAGETKWRENGATIVAQRNALNMLSTLGNGYSKYFYYDSRLWSGYGDHQFSTIESDDSVRSKVAYISALAYLIDGCDVASTTNLSSGNNYCFLFLRGTTPVAALMNSGTATTGANFTNRNAGLNLSLTSFNTFDWMGNISAPTSTNVSFGPWPVYIEGTNGLTYAAMKTALQNAVYATKADTNAPTVAIIEPHRTAETNAITLRWFAVDEVGYSTYIATNVLFSYKLDNVDTDWSSWQNTAHKTYTGVSNLTYFHVRAMDNPGNTSAVETLTLSAQADEGESPPATLKAQRRRGRAMLF